MAGGNKNGIWKFTQLLSDPSMKYFLPVFLISQKYRRIIIYQQKSNCIYFYFKFLSTLKNADRLCAGQN
jgi:hypothetical protein